MSTPCVAYAAKSTADVRGSIPDQLADCRAMVGREGWDLVAEYHDEAFSAYHGDRGPGLARARAHAEQLAGEHGRCVLVSQHSDRFARGDGIQAQHLAEMWFAARRAGIELRSVQDDSTFVSPLLVAALGERNAEDSRRKALAVKAGIARRCANGKPWGDPAYGYRSGADGDWEPNPAEAPVVVQIWDERVKEGRAYQDIAVRLNRDGIAGRRGGNWTASMIKKILEGRYALGYFEYKGEWIKGRHPALIDEDTWLAAQVLAQQGSKYAPSRGGRKPRLHLCIGGMLRCSVCFQAMLPRSDGDHYVCRTNRELRGRGSCLMPLQDRALIDINVVHAIEELFIDHDATKGRIAAELDAHLAQTELECRRADRERAQRAVELARVESDYLGGLLGAVRYEAHATRLEEELKALNAQCERLTRHVEDIRHSRLKLDVDQEVFNRLAELRASIFSTVRSAQEQEDIDAMRVAIRQAVDAVYVGVDGAISFELTDTLARPGHLQVPLPLKTLHGSKLARNRPASASWHNHAASETSVLRPGTCLT